jgi:hypothetical protein
MTTEENVPFVASPELLEAAKAAVAAIEARPSAQRHPMGKMINCLVCGERHREVGHTAFVEKFDPTGKKTVTVEQITTRCVQKFTSTYGNQHDGYQMLKEVEDADGNVSMVPALRTFGEDGERPTLKQVVGAPRKQGFSANRIKAHSSKMKLLFIERTREAFVDLGFDIEETDRDKHSKNLQEAREEAARRIRADHKAAKSLKRFVAEHTRRINRGLENHGSRYVNRDRTILYKAERITR